uniref:Polysaccharide biosynthesis domain-containing protein n=1 Tax=Steinernema glaseri TaxID=37863 RepID=A0A1I7XZ81_9BILA
MKGNENRGLQRTQRGHHRVIAGMIPSPHLLDLIGRHGHDSDSPPASTAAPGGLFGAPTSSAAKPSGLFGAPPASTGGGLFGTTAPAASTVRNSSRVPFPSCSLFARAEASSASGLRRARRVFGAVPTSQLEPSTSPKLLEVVSFRCIIDMAEEFSSLAASDIAAQIDDDPAKYINDPNIEIAWVHKTVERANIHMNLLLKCDTQKLTLHNRQTEIHDKFREAFPEMPINKIIHMTIEIARNLEGLNEKSKEKYTQEYHRSMLEDANRC